MDADTRHQLKTNELGELLTRLGDLRRPEIQYSIAAVLVLLVAWIAYSSWGYMRRQAIESRWQSLTEIERGLDPADPNYASAVDALRGLAGSASEPALAAAAKLRLARIRAADAFDPGADRATPLKEAAELLRSISADSGTPAPLDAAARFGLATVHESLAVVEADQRSEHLKQAEALYHALTSEPRFRGSPYVGLAADRTATLGELAKPVEFQPGDPPAPAAPPTAATPPTTPPAAGQPDIQPMSPDEIERAMKAIQQQTGTPPPTPAPPPAGQSPPSDQQTPPEAPAPADAPPPADPPSADPPQP